MITVFFGSGADTCYSKDLKSGTAFNDALLQGKYAKLINKVLNAKTRNSPLIRSNSKKIFAQTVFYNESIAKEHPCIGETLTKLCIHYYNKGMPKDEAQKKQLNKFFNDSYNSIFGNSDTQLKDFYLKNALFFDTLDEKFNSLRFPDSLNSNAKRVINAYWNVFLLLLQWLYKDLEIINQFGDVLNLLNDGKFKLETNKSNYYSTLKATGIKYNVITTNYTPFVEDYFGKSVVYLHGNLKWFENLNDLQVYEAKDLIHSNIDINKTVFIPFILIPSGIKPLICTKQIEEFHKFIVALNDNDNHELCMIGYKFNSEDNHVNSIVGNWLKKENNHMTVFDFSNDIDFKNFDWSKDFKQTDIEIMLESQTVTKDYGNDKITRYFVDSEKRVEERTNIINERFKTYLNLIEKEEK